MVDNLNRGQIDGYCVGEPWSSCAVKENIGKILISGYQIWNNSPEKVLGVTKEWADKYPNTHLALIKSLIESAQWLDLPENRPSVVDLLSRPDYLGVSPDMITLSMADNFQNSAVSIPANLSDFNVFHRYLANFPWCSHAIWINS